MSIRKAKIILRSKLLYRNKKLIVRTSSKEMMLDKEAAAMVALIDGTRCVEDLAKLLKKNPNHIITMAMELEKLGIVYLQFPCEDRALQELYKKESAIARMCGKQPGLWNVVAYEREWDSYPDSFDFLERESNFFKLKRFEKELYLDLINPFLEELERRSVVLDAGGGIGRFAVDLVSRGFKVHLVDSSEVALKRALGHLQIETGAAFDLHWGNIAKMPMFSDESFDAALAVESVCYCSRPIEAVRELVRVLKKNGLIIIAVEGKYGGMLSDAIVSFDRVHTILHDGPLCIKNNVYVHYYTPASLRELLERCGVEIIDIFGSHYVTDGIFHKLINTDKLSDEGYKKEIRKVEGFCQKDPALKDLARVWVAIGRKGT